MNSQTNPLTRARKKQAFSYFKENQFANAKRLYGEVCKLDRHDAEAWNMLSAIHGMLGEYSEAEQCARQVLALLPEAVGAYNNLANALKLQKKYEEAEEFYRKALNLQPHYAEGYNNLGNLFKDTGRTEEAEAAYRRAIALEPTYADALSNLAKLLGEKNAFSEAETYFRRVLRIRPNLADTWVSLGMLYKQLSRTDDALSCFNHVISQYPDHIDALTAIGGIFKEKGLVKEAIAAFSRVVDLKPDSPGAKYMLATLGAAEIPAESPADYVVSVFDAYAESFDQHLVNRLNYRTPEVLFKLVRSYFPAGSSVDIVDLGCGTGLCGLYFREFATKLVGIDLSPKMLEKARERNVYDELITGDLVTGLGKSSTRFELIIAADVFVYIGDLYATFEACVKALKPGGMFAFSVESTGQTATYILNSSGRYAHSGSYIQELATYFALETVCMKDIVLREELSQPVRGDIYVLRRPGVKNG